MPMFRGSNLYHHGTLLIGSNNTIITRREGFHSNSNNQSEPSYHYFIYPGVYTYMIPGANQINTG
jgi:hypothetical protein